MASGGNVFCGKNSRLNVFVEEILVWIGWHGAVRRQITSFGAEDKFVAKDAPGGELLDGRADGTLAALEAVVDRGVDEVDAVLRGGDDCFRVGAVSAGIRLAQISSDADGGDHQIVNLAEVLVRRVVSPFLRVSPRSFERSPVVHDRDRSPLSSVAGVDESASSCSGGASSLAQARNILRYGQPFSRKN